MTLLGQDVVEVQLTLGRARKFRPRHLHSPLFAIAILPSTYFSTNSVRPVSGIVAITISGRFSMLVEVGVRIVTELISGPLLGEWSGSLLEFLLHSIRVWRQHVIAVGARARALILPRVLISNDIGLVHLPNLNCTFIVGLSLQEHLLLIVSGLLWCWVLPVRLVLRALLSGFSEGEVGEVGP